MSSRQNTRGGILARFEPLFSGLLVALLVALTLGVAFAMGGTEQALVARVNATAAPPAGATGTDAPAALAPRSAPESPTATAKTQEKRRAWASEAVREWAPPRTRRS